MYLTSRQGMALAASLATLVIVAPVAFQQLHERGQNTFGTITSELQPAKGGNTGTNVAVQEPPRRRIDAAGSVEPSPGTIGDPIALKAKPDATAKISRPDANAPVQNATAIAPASSQPAATLDAFSKKAIEERASEMGAMTARKGDGKTEITVAPAANMPAEAAQGLGQPPAAAPSSRAAGGSERERDQASVVAVTPPPPPAPAAAQPSKPASSMTIARLGDHESKREAASPQAWMGGDADMRAPEVQQEIQQENRDKFDAKEINPVKQVTSEPVSTFSIDVDSASYSFVRRALNGGRLPPADAVRVEEMINYFPYAYPAPETAATPFKPTVSVLPSPWNPRNKLVHVAIKGYDLNSTERPRANLVFLVDVSGSMGPQDRLPLIKTAFRMLVDQLQPEDTIGIVTYASGSGIALEPTRAADKYKILAAIERLGAGGSTAGAAGIEDAYRLAESNFDKRAVNRVILATDGDFNVGMTDQNGLKSLIERKRQSGIFLSILGVGQGNHNDALMQTLAQNGNGTAAYVDTLNEARKVLVDEASSTLFTIAKDVKVQIEWNPQAVSEYRLIGYETRNLRREDFNNDRVDAGDIGSGHTVTAIYEVTPVGAPKLTDDLRYGAKTTAAASSEAGKVAVEVPHASELGFLKLRYKRPNEDVSQLVTLPVSFDTSSNDAVSPEVRFSTAVAAFGQLLKGEPYTQGFTFDDVLQLAQSARGDDPFGYRAEFLNLVRLAKSARP